MAGITPRPASSRRLPWQRSWRPMRLRSWQVFPCLDMKFRALGYVWQFPNQTKPTKHHQTKQGRTHGPAASNDLAGRDQEALAGLPSKNLDRRPEITRPKLPGKGHQLGLWSQKDPKGSSFHEIHHFDFGDQDWFVKLAAACRKKPGN